MKLLNDFIIKIFALLLIPFLFGCGHKSEMPSGIWDEGTASFCIEEEGIEYTLPTDISNWAIADQTSTPVQIMFWGIDTSSETCIGIFNPDPPLNGTKSVSGYTEAELDIQIRNIASPQPGQVIFDEKVEKSDKEGEEGKRTIFHLSRKLLDKSMPGDTIPIHYTGYFFNGKNRPYGWVMITGFDPTDSIGALQFQLYASGLKTIGNNNRLNH